MRVSRTLPSPSSCISHLRIGGLFLHPVIRDRISMPSSPRLRRPAPDSRGCSTSFEESGGAALHVPPTPPPIPSHPRAYPPPHHAHWHLHLPPHIHYTSTQARAPFDDALASREQSHPDRGGRNEGARALLNSEPHGSPSFTFQATGVRGTGCSRGEAEARGSS